MPLAVPTVADIENRIVLRILGQQAALTDFTPISVIRIIIREMIAEELAALWAGLLRDQRDWFIQTAQGAALDRRLADYAVNRPVARAATGSITVTVTQDLSVPAGTVARTDPSDASQQKRYRVAGNPDTADGSWPITQTQGSATINIVALNAGLIGNTSAGSITVLENPVTGVSGVTNTLPVINGVDAASDADFVAFYQSYLLSLTRGTRGAILHAIKNYVDPATGAMPVHSVGLVEWGGQTLIDTLGRSVALQVFVDAGELNDSGTTASSDLIDAIQRFVDGADTEDDDGLRSGGVPTIVQAARALPLDVTVALDIDRNANPDTVVQAVTDTVNHYLVALPVGGKRITGEQQGQIIFAQLFHATMSVAGVLRAVFITPSADLGVPDGFKAVPATVTVTVASVS